MTDTLLIKACTLVACVVVLTTGGCTMHKNVLRFDVIKAGVDPMALSCAVGVASNEREICTIIANRGATK